MRDRREAGSTLVEVLIATVLMGSAVIVMVTGLGALFSSSIQNRESVTAGVVARDYAEAVVVAVAQSSAQGSAWCGATYSVAVTLPTGYTVTPTYGGCPVNNATTPQFQTVTLAATAPNGTTEKLMMVVRKS